MFSRRKKNDDRLGPSTGWVKWATKFFRFILYPFIHQESSLPNRPSAEFTKALKESTMTNKITI